MDRYTDSQPSFNGWRDDGLDRSRKPDEQEVERQIVQGECMDGLVNTLMDRKNIL